jgi:mono/diheme cytochrome c family protein
MSPGASAFLTCILLLCGAAAVVIMLNRVGRPQGTPTPRQLVLHRLFGWAFVASFLVLLGTMFTRFYAYWEEDPPRIVLHYTLAFALLVLLALKVAIPRRYPGFRSHLFSLGISVFLLAFLTSSIGLAHYLVRVTQQTPYISHAHVSAIPDLALGKQLFIEKCSTCHLLDTIMRPRPAKDWERVVDDMTKLAWPRVRPDEATQILFYLTETRVPREGSPRTGLQELDVHCLPCHTLGEILSKPRTRPEWSAIVDRMSVTAPDQVPVLQHEQIVDALVAAQARQGAARDPLVPR